MKQDKDSGNPEPQSDLVTGGGQMERDMGERNPREHIKQGTQHDRTTKYDHNHQAT